MYDGTLVLDIGWEVYSSAARWSNEDSNFPQLFSWKSPLIVVKARGKTRGNKRPSTYRAQQRGILVVATETVDVWTYNVKAIRGGD